MSNPSTPAPAGATTTAPAWATATAVAVPPRGAWRKVVNSRRAASILEALGERNPKKVTPVAFKLRLVREVEADGGLPQLNLLGDLDPASEPTAAHGDAQTVDFTDPQTMLERCLIFEPVINPLLHLALVDGLASPRGGRGFYVPINTKDGRFAAERAFDILPAELLYTREAWDKDLKVRARDKALAAMLKKLSSSRIPSLAEQPDEGVYGRVAAILAPANGGYGMSVKFVTRPGGWMDAESAAHRWTAEHVLPPTPIYPDEAYELAYHAGEDGFEIIDTDEVLEDLEKLVRGGAAARQVPGMPGLAVLIEGQGDGEPVTRRRTTAEHAYQIVCDRQARGDKVVAHWRVQDAAAMVMAKPSLDPVLIGPQTNVVAVKVATDVGVLDASSVGSGKTITTLRALRAVALSGQTPGYRALVVCAKGLRSQWAEEEIPHPEHGFPEADVLMVDGRGIARQIADWDRELGEQPGVIVATYEQARLHTDDLRVITYDHLVIDEAARLGNSTTQLARALRRIRERARVCFALTATPIGKSLEELDQIIGVVRDDEEMLRKKTVGRTYRTLDGTSMRRLKRALGPTLVRITREELVEHMPEVLPAKHQMIDGTKAELDLVYGAERRVAELYRNLVEQVAAAQALRPDDPQLEEVRRELASTRGLLVSAGEIALLASVDPEALMASKSVAASLLINEGLVQKAVEAGATLRTIGGDVIAGAVKGGEPILVFSQFSSALRLLKSHVENEHGVEVGLFTGDTSTDERALLKARFQAGELRGLLLGPVGNEGHNLQTRDATSQIVLHYDLPWVPRDLEQRTGRAGRLGGTAKAVAVLVPFMRHTTMERVANLLVPRAAMAHAALDQTRGVESKDSEVARQLAGLAGDLAEQQGSVLMRVCASILSDSTSAAARRRARAAA